MPPKISGSKRKSVKAPLIDLERAAAIMSAIPAPVTVKQDQPVWVKASFPASLAPFVLELWRATAEICGATRYGTIGDSADLTSSPNGYVHGTSDSVYFAFPNRNKAAKWIDEQIKEPFVARVQPSTFEATQHDSWTSGIPTTAITMDVAGSQYPEVLLHIKENRATPSATWSTVLRAINRLEVVGVVTDARDNSIWVPIHRRHQALPLQAAIADILPEGLSVDVVVPEELTSESVFLAVTVKLQSTTGEFPSRAHYDIDSLLWSFYGIAIDHAGDPNGDDDDKPFQSVVAFQGLARAMMCRLAWQRHQLAGHALMWTLRGPIRPEERILSRVEDISSLSNFGRCSSPSSGTGQGGAKRRRVVGEAPRLGGSKLQAGHGGDPLQPINIDDQGEDLANAASPPTSRTSSSRKTNGSSSGPPNPRQQRLGPPFSTTSHADMPASKRRNKPPKATSLSSGVWVRATTPLALGKNAVAMWKRSLERITAAEYGWNPSEASEIKSTLLGFPVGGRVTVYAKFLLRSDAEARTHHNNKLPFCASIMKLTADPTKEEGWVPHQMPFLDDRFSPEAVVRVASKDGKTKPGDMKRWMNTLDLFNIVAFQNHADNTVWIPTRTRQIGEEFCLANWDKNNSLIEATSVKVVGITELKMEQAHLGITIQSNERYTEQYLRGEYKGLRSLMADFFPDCVDTMNEVYTTRSTIDHMVISFDSVVNSLRCAVIWHDSLMDHATCFWRGPVNRDPPPAPKKLTATSELLKQPPFSSGASSSPTRNRSFTVEDEEEDPPANQSHRPSSPPPFLPSGTTPQTRRQTFTFEDESDDEESTGQIPKNNRANCDPKDWISTQVPDFNVPAASPEEVAKIKLETIQFIRDWYIIHKCRVPSEDEINEVLALLPQTPQWYWALSYARRTKGNSVHALISALAEWYKSTDQSISRDSPAIYIACVQTISGCLADVCARLGNVSGVQRERMQSTMATIAQDLMAAGHSPEYVVSLLYAGSTWMLCGRGKFDAIKFPFDGLPSEDRRQPLIVAETIGARAKTINDLSYFSLDEEGARLHGHKEEILGPDGKIRRDEEGNVQFPAVCRLPVISILHAPRHLWAILESIVAGLCSPAQLNVQLGGLEWHCLDAEMVALLKSKVRAGADVQILFLGDATGVKGWSFEDSATGHIFVLMVETFTGQQGIRIRILDVHSRPGHESNDEIVTPDDIKKIKVSIGPNDLLIPIFGTSAAGTNAWNYLFDGNDAPRMDQVGFFEPFTATVLGKRRVFILLPHVGVLNYVGHLDWIIQAYADVIPILLMLGTFSMDVKEMQAFLSQDAAETILQLYHQCDVCATFSQRLEWPKMRSMWDGRVAPRAQRHLDAGVPWKEVYRAVAEERGKTVIWSLAMLGPDPTPLLIRKRYENCGAIKFRITVPSINGDGRFDITKIEIPAQFRGETDFYATLHLNPQTLHLQLLRSDGTLVTSVCGTVFSIPRAHWMMSASYCPWALEAHARCQGIWKPLSSAEIRQIRYLERLVDEGNTNSWFRLRCVHTLEEQEIIRGVAVGEPYLHPILDSYAFLFWDGGDDFLYLRRDPSGKNSRWDIAEFKTQRPAGVVWVAPFIDSEKSWRFHLYGCSADSNYTPFCMGKSTRVIPSSRWKEEWPVLNGGRDIHLYKEVIKKQPGLF